MNKEHINSLGQRVVDVEIGYKVYDSEHKGSVILRVGNNRNGSCMYKDTQPVVDNTDEICFMSEKILMNYEMIVKLFASDRSLTWDQQLHKIIELNKGCGLKGTDINEICKSNGKDPIGFFNDFFGQIPE